ncbi:MAG TPA: serine hydrolase domain-containing protein [Longimicrobium sp.]
MKRYSTLAAAALVLSAAPAVAQAPANVVPSSGAPAALPASAIGRIAQALLDAINSGDSARVRRWADTSLSESARRREPIEGQVAFLQRVQAQSGGLDVTGISRAADPLRFDVRVRRTGRPAHLLLGTGRGEPNRAEGVGVFAAAPPMEPWTRGRFSEAEIRDTIAARVAAAVARDEFSGVVRVMKGDRVVLEQAWGEAERGFHVPNNVETRFNIASMGKMFTAVAIAQLVEAGKLSFDDTLAKVLPDYPNAEAARKITIHQLLTHSAGLGPFFERPGYDRRKDYPTAASLLEVFAREPLAYEPGTRAEYSNEGFVVLGAVVERVSGENYYEYVRRHVWAPAGMTRTDAYAINDPVENLAVGYGRFDDDPLGMNPRRPNWAFLGLRGTPAGGFYSTAGDMARFAQALRGGKLVSAAMVERLTTVKEGGLRNYGYGFQVFEVDGEGVVGHDGGGGSSGINSDLYWLADGSWTVAVMGNYDAPAAQRVARAIMGFVAGH